jgi:hypothetical protein
MSAVYQNHGIQFQYPENWQVIEEDKEWPREVYVESPCGGFWSLHVYSPPDDPHQLVGDVLEVMRAEYKSVEAESAHEKIGGSDANGYDLFFFYLDLVVRCRVRGFTLNDKTLVLLTQAEDRDFERLLPVFDAMTTSLVRHLGEPNSAAP